MLFLPESSPDVAARPSAFISKPGVGPVVARMVVKRARMGPASSATWTPWAGRKAAHLLPRSFRKQLAGKPKHDVERCWWARPVRFDEIGAAPPKDTPQCEGDDDGVVEVAGDRNEVGDEVERHEQIRDQGNKDELLTAGDAGIREQSLEEDHAIGNERRRGSRPFSTTGQDENGDEHGVKRGRCNAGHENCLPEFQH